MRFRRALEGFWYGRSRSRWRPAAVGRGAVALALWPLSKVYGAVASMRRTRNTDRAASTPIPIPVVVVGNITVGGAGKTPLVLALVDALRARGYVPGIVSRGYGGRRLDEARAVDATLPDATAEFGDEPVMARRRSGAPVFIGRERTDAAYALVAAHPDVDVLLSDDGLQHYRLPRNFEIAVFDSRGAGNRQLLPAGPLREPLSRLTAVDAIVLNGADTELPEMPMDAGDVPRAVFRMELMPGDPYRVTDPSTTRPLQQFRGKRITAAAGIGNPQRFFALLRSAGLSFHRMPLSDHHRYRDNPFMRRNSEAVLMTEKDAVKCARFDEPRMWAVPVTARVDESLVDAIVARIGAPRTAVANTQAA